MDHCFFYEQCNGNESTKHSDNHFMGISLRVLFCWMFSLLPRDNLPRNLLQVMSLGYMMTTKNKFRGYEDDILLNDNIRQAIASRLSESSDRVSDGTIQETANQ